MGLSHPGQPLGSGQRREGGGLGCHLPSPPSPWRLSLCFCFSLPPLRRNSLSEPGQHGRSSGWHQRAWSSLSAVSGCQPSSGRLEGRFPPCYGGADPAARVPPSLAPEQARTPLPTRRGANCPPSHHCPCQPPRCLLPHAVWALQREHKNGQVLGLPPRFEPQCPKCCLQASMAGSVSPAWAFCPCHSHSRGAAGAGSATARPGLWDVVPRTPNPARKRAGPPPGTPPCIPPGVLGTEAVPVPLRIELCKALNCPLGSDTPALAEAGTSPGTGLGTGRSHLLLEEARRGYTRLIHVNYIY